MANTTYQVILSTDGKHTVIVTSDDPNGIKAAGSWAKSTYEGLIQTYGHKYAPKQSQPEQGQASEAEEAPICAVHQIPMIWIDKNGGFWSCHQRNADGSFCKYRPPKAA